MTFRPLPKMITIIISILIVLVVAAALVICLHPAIGRSPRGERLERMSASPNYRDGRFFNLEETPEITSDKGLLRTLWDALFIRPADLTPSVPVKAIKTDLRTLPLTTDRLVWLGHSSYFMILAGKRILVDPVLTSEFPVSLMMKPFPGSDIYTPADIPETDILIITHDHYDHLDYATIKEIRDRVKLIICPLGVGEHLEYWGVKKDKIRELDWYQTITCSPLTIECLPARHFSGRLFKRGNTLWASYMISLPDGTTVYAGGDSGYGKHYAEIARRYPEVTYAVLENGQYNHDWRYIHTLPSQQDSVIRDLCAKNVFSVHNSKYALARHPWHEPIDNIRATAAADSSFNLLDAIIGQPVKLK